MIYLTVYISLLNTTACKLLNKFSKTTIKAHLEAGIDLIDGDSTDVGEEGHRGGGSDHLRQAVGCAHLQAKQCYVVID